MRDGISVPFVWGLSRMSPVLAGLLHVCAERRAVSSFVQGDGPAMVPPCRRIPTMASDKLQK